MAGRADPSAGRRRADNAPENGLARNTITRSVVEAAVYTVHARGDNLSPPTAPSTVPPTVAPNEPCLLAGTFRSRTRRRRCRGRRHRAADDRTARGRRRRPGTRRRFIDAGAASAPSPRPTSRGRHRGRSRRRGRPPSSVAARYRPARRRQRASDGGVSQLGAEEPAGPSCRWSAPSVAGPEKPSVPEAVQPDPPLVLRGSGAAGSGAADATPVIATVITNAIASSRHCRPRPAATGWQFTPISCAHSWIFATGSSAFSGGVSVGSGPARAETCRTSTSFQNTRPSTTTPAMLSAASLPTTPATP